MDHYVEAVDLTDDHRPAGGPSIAVLIPCYNEALTVGEVVKGFRAALPEAIIYVYDNNSTDGTVEAARRAGARLATEALQGKGHVVRRMFRDIEADFYILVDGDGTYDADLAPQMLALARAHKFDLVNCARISAQPEAYRFGHQFGNRFLTGMVKRIFGNRVRDMLSGYKLLSRRFVKSFPAISGGFDIETELTIHALELSLPIAHVEGRYLGRPEGSTSKLSTYKDGMKILWLIAVLVKHERPIQLFSFISAILLLLAISLGLPVILNYFATGLVQRLPTAVLATGLVLIAALSFYAGLILDTVTRGRREAKLLAYLQHRFHE